MLNVQCMVITMAFLYQRDASGGVQPIDVRCIITAPSYAGLSQFSPWIGTDLLTAYNTMRPHCKHMINSSSMIKFCFWRNASLSSEPAIFTVSVIRVCNLLHAMNLM